MSACCAPTALVFSTLFTMQDVQAQFFAQLEAIKNVPGRVLANYPAFFSLGLINIVTATVINAVPSLPGYGGDVLNAALNGFADVTKHVAWEATRVAA